MFVMFKQNVLTKAYIYKMFVMFKQDLLTKAYIYKMFLMFKQDLWTKIDVYDVLKFFLIMYSTKCCHIRCSYHFRIKMMFGSSFPPVVCRRAHVLFTLFVFVCIQYCPTHIVLCSVFVLFVFVLCLVSCVLCTQCCQFFWFDHS